MRSCTRCLHKDAWCTKTSRPHAWSRKDVFFSRNCQNCQGAHRASLTGTRSWRRAASKRRSLPPFLRSTKIAVVQEPLSSLRRPSEDLCAQGSQNTFVQVKFSTLFLSLVFLFHNLRYHDLPAVASVWNKSTWRSVPGYWCAFRSVHDSEKWNEEVFS